MTTPLQNSLEIFMTDVQRLQEENERLKAENEKLRIFISPKTEALEKLNKKLGDVILSKEKENQDLKMALDEANENILYERIEILEGENEKLKEFYIGLSAENQQLKEQLETQKGLVEVYRESDSRLQRAVDKYKEQLQQLQNEKINKPEESDENKHTLGKVWKSQPNINHEYCEKLEKIRQSVKDNMHLFKDKQSQEMSEIAKNITQRVDAFHEWMKKELQPEHCDISGVKLDSKPKRVPHKCPVCDGKRKIMNNENIYCVISSDFYLDKMGNRWQPCKSCNGTGIVWEPK